MSYRAKAFLTCTSMYRAKRSTQHQRATSLSDGCLLHKRSHARTHAPAGVNSSVGVAAICGNNAAAAVDVVDAVTPALAAPPSMSGARTGAAPSCRRLSRHRAPRVRLRTRTHQTRHALLPGVYTRTCSSRAPERATAARRRQHAPSLTPLSTTRLHDTRELCSTLATIRTHLAQHCVYVASMLTCYQRRRLCQQRRHCARSLHHRRRRRRAL
jgi:hypothetical protein